MGESGFAGSFEIIVPNGGNGEVVILPELTLVSSAVAGEGGVTRTDGVGLTVFVEEVGEADLEENVVVF